MEKNYTKIQPNEVFGAPPDSQSDSQKGVPAARTDTTTASTPYFAYHWKHIWWGIKFLLVFGIVSVLLAIPLILYRDIENFPDDVTEDELKDRLTRLWVYNIFLFFFATWVAICASYLLGTALPYIFRFVAR